MMTTNLGPPELLEPDRAGIIPSRGQIGQHNHDESDQRLCQERSNSAQSYCNPNSRLKGGLSPCSPS